MIGAIIEFTNTGRVKTVYLIGLDEDCQAVVECGLARLTKANHWAWLKKLVSRKPGPRELPETGRKLATCSKCRKTFYQDIGHRCQGAKQ